MPTSPSSAPARPLSRRLLGGLAAAAVAPLVTGDPASAAPSAARGSAADRRRRRRRRRHARVCRHWHRCPRHRGHTCGRKHRCRHRHHRAPKPPSTPTPEAPAGQPPVAPPPVPPTTAYSGADLHLVNRFTYGTTPGLQEEISAAGGPAAWFERQLDPLSLPDPDGDATRSWWASIDLPVAEIVGRDKAEVESGWAAMANYARWCLVRRIASRRQVLEVMAEFWEHHLHVPVHDDGVYPFRAEYGRLVREHALGRFDRLLVAATTHPAMGVSLDNASSTKWSPNENLARELLELHTVGKGHHTEDDVKDAARILTGYRVDTWRSWKVWYDTGSHATGPVSVAGFSHQNSDPDGRPVAEAFLQHLARHPDTARRIARKLAVRFVSDEPSPELVAHLADVYLGAQTAIVPVLRALVAHPEFAAAVGAKVRTPTDDVVATYRALQARLARPTSGSSAANAILWQAGEIGQGPFDWPRPDGQPQDNRSWSSVSRLLASFSVHYDVANRWWPTRDVTYRSPVDRLPAPAVRFDVLVDHLCADLLGRPASAQLLQAACEATRLTPETVITADHGLVRWHFGLLLATLLDTPEHLHR